MTPTPSYTYWTDNGRCLCFEHLGQSARATGRDISGQPIERIDRGALAAMRKAYPNMLKLGTCEHCGASPSQ